MKRERLKDVTAFAAALTDDHCAVNVRAWPGSLRPLGYADPDDSVSRFRTYGSHLACRTAEYGGFELGKNYPS